MPTYAYACTECDHRFEAVQSFSEDSLSVCPVCGGRLRKIFNAVGVVFKGSGFYRNDSRAKVGAGSSSSSSGDARNGGDTSNGDTSNGDLNRADKNRGDKNRGDGNKGDGDKRAAASGGDGGSSGSSRSDGKDSTSASVDGKSSKSTSLDRFSSDGKGGAAAGSSKAPAAASTS